MELFAKTHFWILWRFSAWKWAKLPLIYSKRHLQHIYDSMPFHKYHVLQHFCLVKGDDVRTGTKAGTGVSGLMYCTA